MATITIANDPHPKDEAQDAYATSDLRQAPREDGDRIEVVTGRSNTTHGHDDIYNIRSRDIRSRSRGRSASRARQWVVGDDDDPDLRRQGDFKQKQVCEAHECVLLEGAITQGL